MPGLIGVGLVDQAVPAPTVLAIADRLGGPHEVLRFRSAILAAQRAPLAGVRAALAGAGAYRVPDGFELISRPDRPAPPSRAQSRNQGRPGG